MTETMTMEELEADILNDLEELGDPISRYTYLTACAGECLPFPEEEKNDQYLIRECQANTWVHLYWEKEQCCFLADSESLIVKGALALLQELYNDRSREEIAAYRCGLLNNDLFANCFTREQRVGLTHIIEENLRLPDQVVRYHDLNRHSPDDVSPRNNLSE